MLIMSARTDDRSLGLAKLVATADRFINYFMTWTEYFVELPNYSLKECPLTNGSLIKFKDCASSFVSLVINYGSAGAENEHSIVSAVKLR